MAFRFSSDSHTMVSFCSLIYHPNSVMGFKTMVFMSACFHIPITQNDRCQCKNRESSDGTISLSNLIRSKIFCISSSQEECCWCSVNMQRAWCFKLAFKLLSIHLDVTISFMSSPCRSLIWITSVADLWKESCTSGKIVASPWRS